MTREIFME